MLWSTLALTLALATPAAPTDAKICLACHATAPGTLRGHWDGVAMKARSLQLRIDAGAEVLRFDPAALRVVGSSEQDLEKALRGIRKGHEVRIEYAEQDGARFAKVVAVKPPVKLGAEERVGVAEVEALVAAPEKGFLFDARPAPRFREGAIPTAVSLPFPEFDRLADRLPARKDALVVFYCSGPTCNMSPGAQRKAKALGYGNVKVFVEGLPGWLARNPGAVAAQGLAEAYRDVPYVLLDARAPTAAEQGFLRGAVAGTDEALASLPKKEAKAPIVVYDADGKGEAGALARRLVAAGQPNVLVLQGGLAAARAAGLAVEQGALATTVRWAPKPKPGEYPLDDFRRLAEAPSPEVVVVDVRNPDELTDGAVKGARNVPADQIDRRAAELPRDRKVVTYCGTGTRAEMAYHSLQAKGFTDVAFVNAKVEFEDGKITITK